MTLNFESEYEKELPFDAREVAEKVFTFTMDYLGCPYEAEVSLLLTDDETIHQINKEQRDIDRATDVLSFPMFQFTPGQVPEDVQEDIDPQTGLLPLGDMAISLERARDQAKRFGNSLRRETGYLTIHSILHLLGYDHMDEGEMKRQMRTREEIIAGQLGLQR